MILNKSYTINAYLYNNELYNNLFWLITGLPSDIYSDDQKIGTLKRYVDFGHGLALMGLDGKPIIIQRSKVTFKPRQLNP